VLAMTEIAKIDASAAVIMSVNNSLVCAGMEILFRRTKMKYLVPLAKIGAFCLSQKQEVMQLQKKRQQLIKEIIIC
jgi:alkylation response protein AidB-like acyl-CoA dehydrogenase